jgi:hypothetical protein
MINESARSLNSNAVVFKGVPTPFVVMLTTGYLMKCGLNSIFVVSLIVNTINLFKTRSSFVQAFFRKFKGHAKTDGHTRTCSADYPEHALIGLMGRQ